MSNKQLVEQFFDKMNSGDVDGFVGMYHDDGELWTMGGTLISGKYSKAQIQAAAAGIYEAFPKGIVFTISGITAEGDRVAVEASSKGEHISGAIYENQYHFLFEFKGGQVLRLKEYMDTERVTDVLCGGQRP